MFIIVAFAQGKFSNFSRAYKLNDKFSMQLNNGQLKDVICDIYLE